MELYSHEVEGALLAVVMNHSQIEGVGAARLLLEREQLGPDDFHLPAHAATYAAILASLGAQQPADPVVMWERLRSAPAVEAAGGLKWLLALAVSGDNLVSEAFPGYAKLVRDYALRRRMVSISAHIAELARRPIDVGDALALAAKQLVGITYRKDTFQTMSKLLTEVYGELDRSQEGTSMRLTPTGIRSLDSLIGGLPPVLVVVAGRPGAGKSAIATTLTENLARQNIRTGVFSLEDRAPWLAWRLLAGNSGISNQKLRFQKLNAMEWSQVGEAFAKVNTYSDLVLIDDRRRMTASDIVQSARNMIVNHGVRALLIDHLLEVKNAERLARRDLEVADSLGQFRDLANEYEIPVVVFTQLNRGSESKKQPTLTDFKDAGAVEEMARVAIAITRDGDRIGLHVIKNTNGAPGSTEVEFIGAAAMVASVERQGRLM